MERGLRPPYFSMTQIERFMTAFEGSDVAYGQTKIGDTRRNGKTEAKSFVVREPWDATKVQEHLEGKIGVGMVPINTDNKCKFGVIDIDTYPIDHAQLCKRLKQFSVPMIVCRSKSGGAHLYLFLDEWMQASTLREYLSEIAAAMGHAQCEIFPKQDKILAERGDVGNFINLPYFDAENTTRYAFDLDGNDLELDAFLDLVEANRASHSDLEALTFGSDREDLKEGPPCTELIAHRQIQQGERNEVLFHAAWQLKRQYPETWKSELEEFNRRYCVTPLPASEIVAIQIQHEKKDYGPSCKKEPMCSYCNVQECKQRKFGINSSEMMPKLGGLTILLSEPRLYFLDVDGSRLELSVEQLQVPLQFQRQCMEQLNFMPPIPKSSDWQSLVNGLLSDATTVSVPEELTTTGQFKELVETYCSSRIRAITPEELELGKPYTEEGKTYFKMQGLEEFCRQRGFTKFNRTQMQERLKDMNGGEECHRTYRYKTDQNEWRGIRVWWVPEFINKEPQLPVEEHEYEPPF